MNKRDCCVIGLPQRSTLRLCSQKQKPVEHTALLFLADVIGMMDKRLTIDIAMRNTFAVTGLFTCFPFQLSQLNRSVFIKKYDLPIFTGVLSKVA